ncbi:uncharacterized protein LOC141776560 [Sebastes fasciatus]|uniref:uncharacterized protein LOC141776560 n=1 Tax=Sebastes fasciatus TaxID=394691 RepID=UPI003D9E421F
MSGWVQAGFKTSQNKPMAHEELMKELLEAIQLPQRVAVIKVKGHSQGTDLESIGNEAADAAAKKAAGYLPTMMVMTTADLGSEITDFSIIQAQESATAAERTIWEDKGAIEQFDGIWYNGDQIVMPPCWMSSILTQTHGLDHKSHKQMLRDLRHWWIPRKHATITDFLTKCDVCSTCNIRPTITPRAGKHPSPTAPGQEIFMDFTDMGVRAGGKRFLLVIVDAFSRWVEAYPTGKEDAKSVIKCLVNEYIPKHGFPKLIRSDNGSHFKNKDLQSVEKALGLQHKFGTVYHPESQGKVERANQTIKLKLLKIVRTTGLPWTEALPIALIGFRASVNRSTGLTPFELTCGRPFPGPSQNPSPLPDLGYRPYYLKVNALVSALSYTGDKPVTPVTEDVPGPDPGPPEHLWLKVLKRKWSEPRWTGPHKVLARTATAVQLAGKGLNWWHLTQCSSSRTGPEAEEAAPQGAQAT